MPVKESPRQVEEIVVFLISVLVTMVLVSENVVLEENETFCFCDYGSADGMNSFPVIRKCIGIIVHNFKIMQNWF